MSRVVSTSKLASDWLHKREQPIRGQVSKLTQFLRMTTTHKFPLQAGEREEVSLADGVALMVKEAQVCYI